MCGDIVYALKDPFPLEDKGTFAAVAQGRETTSPSAMA